MARKEDGQALWFLGSLVIVKASNENTGGSFGLSDHLLPAGFATPYHLHRNQDESFYVIDGEIAFILNGEKVVTHAGDFIFGARNVPHGFRVEGNATARLLVISTPPGFEDFAVEAGEPARELVLPKPSVPDFARLAEIAAKYGIDILGPLPA